MRIFIPALLSIALVGCTPELDEEPRCRLTANGWVCDDGASPPDAGTDLGSPEAGHLDDSSSPIEDSGPAEDTITPETSASCAEHKDRGDSGRGLRTIAVGGAELEVFCDQDVAGGGWMLVARSVAGGTGNFGWTTSRGTVTDDSQPFSLNRPELAVSELLIGDRGEGKAWGNRIFQVALPNDFWNSCDGASCATTVTSVAGTCANPTMFNFAGRISRTDSYWFRDVSEPNPFGLFPSGWSVFYDDCTGGELEGRQGMIFRSLSHALPHDNLIRALWSVAIFTAASLLFVVQPMVAKALLPSLGGSSAVWTTCMLFFQIALLVGYAWAHLASGRFSTRGFVVAHLAASSVAALTLPFTLDASSGAALEPVWWVVSTLTLAVGATFVALAATSPLLQSWYAELGLDDSSDPYFLYAASNLGSMLALIAYPVVIEPNLGVGSQIEAWAYGYLLFLALMGTCATVTWRRASKDSPSTPDESARLDLRAAAIWVGLAFVPSSLMLGSTQHITIDIAPVPLLWALPLAAYLGSFIIAFGRRGWRIPKSLYPALPLMILGLIAIEGFDLPIAVTTGAHILGFAIIATLFHGWLAERRPEPSRLTHFYLAVAFGGALGGLFNGVLAPLLFDRNLDYFLVLAIAAALVPVSARHFDELKPRTTSLASLVVASAAYLWAVGVFMWPPLATTTRIVEWAAGLGALGAALLLSWWRPRLHHVGYALVLLVGAGSILHTRGAVDHARSFYATYKVFDRSYGGLDVRKFSHGTTSHGAQFLDPSLRRIPTAYHHPEGPVGQVVDAFEHDRAAVLGLGIGAMAAYPGPGDRWDFIEIDPLVVELAREHFRYLADCGDRCHVLTGDGRLLLESSTDDTYDIIFLDAYNSDSVPAHLLTREALQLYLHKLQPDGVIVFHVSNRYLNVEGIVGALVADAGLASRTQVHWPRDELRRLQVRTSAYVVVARDDELLKELDGERWRTTERLESVWTDDASNLLEAFEW